MITLVQIKAARALLDWKQDDLAKQAGLSLPSINNIERGVSSARPETLMAIHNAFADAGIEFIEGNGLRMRPAAHSIHVFEGGDFIERLDTDIFQALQKPTDEILAFSCGERHWITYAGATNARYIKDRRLKGWKERILIPNNSDFITSPAAAYRCLPPGFFSGVTYETYADRLALIEWAVQRVTIIRSHHIAAGYKAQFEQLWEAAKPLTAAQLKKIVRWKAEEGV